MLLFSASLAVPPRTSINRRRRAARRSAVGRCRCRQRDRVVGAARRLRVPPVGAALRTAPAAVRWLGARGEVPPLRTARPGSSGRDGTGQESPAATGDQCLYENGVWTMNSLPRVDAVPKAVPNPCAVCGCHMCIAYTFCGGVEW